MRQFKKQHHDLKSGKVVISSPLEQKKKPRKVKEKVISLLEEQITPEELGIKELEGER